MVKGRVKKTQLGNDRQKLIHFLFFTNRDKLSINNDPNNVDQPKYVAVGQFVNKNKTLVNVVAAIPKELLDESRIPFMLMAIVNLVNIHGKWPF